MKNKLFLRVASFITLFLTAQTALAACYVNGEQIPCGSFPWWIFIIIFGAAIFFFVFWLKMLIHAIKSPNPGKVGWVILIVLTQVLGAIIYYFAVKRSE